MLKTALVTTFFLTLTVPAAVFAAGDAASAGYVREQHLTFEEHVVQADHEGPDTPIVEGERPTRRSLLFRLRDSFVPELLKSAEQI